MTERLAVVQIDSVNVLSRSHYLPAFSRLGAYPRAALDELTARRHAVFEYWAHEASFLPVRLQPHLRWRMAAAEEHAWGNMVRLQRERPGFVAEVLDRVRDDGPLKASDLAEPRPDRPGIDVELARRQGRARVAVLHRRGHRDAPHDGLREGLRPHRAGAAARRPARRRRPTRPRPSGSSSAPPPARSGVATERDLRDYFRLRPGGRPRRRSPSSPTPVSCCPSRWPAGAHPAWLDPAARRPRWIRARALLSPFDSLVWERPRVERIFGFRYRLEIYTPAAKRVHGYYVLPFLLGDQLVARVDLKADRQAGVLRVQAAHAEEGVERPLVAAALADELRLMADWLELDDVVVADRAATWPAPSTVSWAHGAPADACASAGAGQAGHHGQPGRRPGPVPLQRVAAGPPHHRPQAHATTTTSSA